MLVYVLTRICALTDGCSRCDVASYRAIHALVAVLAVNHAIVRLSFEGTHSSFVSISFHILREISLSDDGGSIKFPAPKLNTIGSVSDRRSVQ